MGQSSQSKRPPQPGRRLPPDIRRVKWNATMKAAPDLIRAKQAFSTSGNVMYARWYGSVYTVFSTAQSNNQLLVAHTDKLGGWLYLAADQAPTAVKPHLDTARFGTENAKAMSKANMDALATKLRNEQHKRDGALHDLTQRGYVRLRADRPMTRAEALILAEQNDLTNFELVAHDSFGPGVHIMVLLDATPQALVPDTAVSAVLEDVY